MKFTLPFSLLVLFAFAACEIDEPPPRSVRGRPATRYPVPEQSQYPAQPQPFPTEVGPTTPPAEIQESQAATAPTVAPSTTTTTKGDPPYGVPVPGKPGFVTSPFSPDKLTDVRGYAPGTEVKDPYTGKIFLVP